MKFVNFSFSNPVQSSTLIGLGCEWDLHNYSDFAGFKFDPLEDCLRIEWLVPAVENPWGCTENRTKGCALKFKNLKRVEVTARDKATLSLEDACLLGISKVIPDRTEHRFKAEWQDDEPFHLLLEFESGRTIEVASDTAELELVEGTL